MGDVPWKIDVVCITCGYVAASGGLTVVDGHGAIDGMEVPAECPSCYVLGLKGKAPTRGASRFAIWREVRRARRAMRDLA
jgi:hypothetical protein